METREAAAEAGYFVVWSYRPRPGREDEFLAEYGGSGSWARLFARSGDYMGTRLLHPERAGASYLVIDLWRTAEAHSRFMARCQSEYDTLSRRLSVLWSEEVNVGSFQAAGNFPEAHTSPPETGSTGLAALVRDLRPNLSDTPYVFVTTPQAGSSLLEAALATYREEEGVTLVLDRGAASALGWEGGPFWARITLEVHSSLHAVGLLALVSAALAEIGIACNPMSAWFHDHLFVPWDDRQRALEALEALAARGT